MSTPSLKQSEITRNWYLIDAKGQNLGRLSVTVAKLLTGKQKPTYTPHMDAGDHVIVINAAKFKTSGTKLESKQYHRHSGYPGSLKTRSLQEFKKMAPEEVIQKSVRGMLADNKLRRKRLARLHVYADANHGHEGQKPQEIK